MARKQTVFLPCKAHEHLYARESRYRRGEVMVEGGWAGQGKCECHMRPGTDFYNADFVSENPVYYVNR